MHRRLPKRGFNNVFRKEYTIVNLDTLSQFEPGASVAPETLLEKGIVKKLRDGIKILGNGELKHAVNVRAHKFSKGAAEKIQSAGGTIEVIVG